MCCACQFNHINSIFVYRIAYPKVQLYVYCMETTIQDFLTFERVFNDSREDVQSSVRARSIDLTN